MRSEMNIGGDGGDRSSVRVHAAPGGQQHFNIFGGEDPSVARQSHKISSVPSYSAGAYGAPQETPAPTDGVQFPSQGGIQYPSSYGAPSQEPAYPSHMPQHPVDPPTYSSPSEPPMFGGPTAAPTGGPMNFDPPPQRAAPMDAHDPMPGKGWQPASHSGFSQPEPMYGGPPPPEPSYGGPPP